MEQNRNKLNEESQEPINYKDKSMSVDEKSLNAENHSDQSMSKEDKNTFDPYAPHRIKWWGWPLLMLLILGTIYIFHTEGRNRAFIDSVTNSWSANETQRAEGTVFGTFYHITYMSKEDLKSGIEQTLRDVDNSLSPFNKKSTITAINEGTSMKTDKMFTEVFQLAKTVSKETNGAFDITVAPLVNLWGFGFKTGEKVSDQTVDSLRKYVGFDSVEIQDGEVVKQHRETMLDCSAIAKGFGVDAVGKFLESKGIHSYMVEIGGEVRLRGVNPKGKEWSIGVSKPEDDSLSTNDDLQQVIMTTNISMATSGNYRNFYVKDGKKYAHTIDPRTGYPVQHSILSSTVLAKDCATADAYATAFMVLGLEEAFKVLKKHQELDAFFIYTDKDGNMKEIYTKGMKKLLQR